MNIDLLFVYGIDVNLTTPLIWTALDPLGRNITSIPYHIIHNAHRYPYIPSPSCALPTTPGHDDQHLFIYTS